MRIFKFGGASVQDAAAVRNVAEILKNYGQGPLVVVISAMGKTTNALEEVLNAWWEGTSVQEPLNKIRAYHYEIMESLFPNKNEAIWELIEDQFLALELYFEKPLERNYDMQYDQVVSYGELLSTRIVSAYLNESGYRNKWVDARNFIITDDLFREARISWQPTTSLLSQRIKPIAEAQPVIIQGFIGSTQGKLTTTLGREGSDFTASVCAYALDAQEIVIWKDVPGILNADPKKFQNTIQFDEMSYSEAIEMTYYGARVLHPKTIKPIQNKNIPLNVRSFIHPAAPGTIIRADIPARTDVPIIILKENQHLLSLSTRDFSFIAEENIEVIFDAVVRHGIKVNVMHNSAISFHICIDAMEQKTEAMINSLNNDFSIDKLEGLRLLTIKHKGNTSATDLIEGCTIVMEQISGDTVQYVLK
jgi:aspartate kinase